MMRHTRTKDQGSWLSCFRQEYFWPQNHDLNKPGKVPLGDITYHISRIMYCAFRQVDFECLLYICLYKTEGVGCVLPRGHNLNKLYIGLLADTTYQILVSRLYA